MKCLLALCLISVALAAPSEKRFIEQLGLGNLGGSLFDLDTLKCDVQLMLDVIGADPSEVICENECHKLLQEGHVLNYGCPLVCHGFQTLVHQWHVVPGDSLCKNGGAVTPVA